MVFLVCCWGLEFIFAKKALEAMEPLTLVFFKYTIGAILVLAFKFRSGDKSFISKKDIPIFFICAFLGEIGYFYCEYTAMDYLPISLITIVLSFVPVFSIFIEKILYKRSATKPMMVGVFFCVCGVTLVIGADYQELMTGRLVGYVLAFGAVAFWNAYNFITASLHNRYTSLSLTFNQLVCSILLLLPYALFNPPKEGSVDAGVIGAIIFLGIVSGAMGFIILVRALHVIGVTPTAMFSNFLPVTGTFFGWLCFGETISFLQFVGGIIIIGAACLVIHEKEKIVKQTETNI
ncbi:MAG: DMT family transporter [Eubacteriales bacterium]|nr:DMT family transporter [Eubacteriales bacterium]MDD4583587.1 DMT family transporter [Eubacteriales bacterium]